MRRRDDSRRSAARRCPSDNQAQSSAWLSVYDPPSLAFFGFTHCPDICPTTLFELTDFMKKLGPEADRFNVLFFTVDPEKDTKNLLAQYMTTFGDRIFALRRSREETDAVVKASAAYVRIGAA